MNADNLLREIEGFSLFGEPLIQIPLVSEIVDVQQKYYDEASEKYRKDPNDAENIIWLGRRTAYLGRMREAIAIFSEGIKKFPKDSRMYRHRGHRFITLRRFKLAIDDLLVAVQLIEGNQDEIEPDGIPNPKGVPVSSLHSNIWYHLGLAYYLEGKYEESLDAYIRGLDALALEDNYVACAHWIYMILRLLDRKEESEKVLKKITTSMDIIENHYYYKILLMYKGYLNPEEMMKEARNEGELGNAAIAYALANWYYYNNRKDKAITLLEEILSLENWATFGYIAAEADLKRMDSK
ncbi:MAG: hypothetical protein ACW96U_10445 [Candidatus Heimdallarchaeaceae archaeon]|jgi:tetratricopeptide (TPR) repeat protein